MPMNFNSDDVDADYRLSRRAEPGATCYGCGEEIPNGARDCGQPVCRERARRAQRRPEHRSEQ